MTDLDKYYGKLLLKYILAMVAVIVIFTILIQVVLGYKMAFVGDFDDDKDSLAVRNAVYRYNPNMVNLLGDMSYSHNDSFVKNQYFYVFSDLKCLMGNHDLKIISLKMRCGEWYYQYDQNLVFGVNSEKEIYSQVVNLVNLMDHLKPERVFVLSHKPCTDVNMESFCDITIANNRINASLLFISGHKHICATSKYQEVYFMLIAGCGGAFHQHCSVPQYMFCNDVDYGFLSIELKEEKIKATFYDTNLKILHQVKKLY